MAQALVPGIAFVVAPLAAAVASTTTGLPAAVAVAVAMVSGAVLHAASRD